MECIAAADKEFDRVIAAGARRCLVSFSGGKDSLCILDMATRRFDHVEAFFMYFVPGLECVEAELEKARARWGVKVHQVRHWATAEYLREGVYCLSEPDIDQITLSDVYDVMRGRTGCDVIAYGGKKSDGMWRQRAMAKNRDARRDDVVAPLREWNKLHVLSYLAAQRIPVPAGTGGTVANGIGLRSGTLLWLYQNYPGDFERVAKLFPYVRAAVRRYELYGEAKAQR